MLTCMPASINLNLVKVNLLQLSFEAIIVFKINNDVDVIVVSLSGSVKFSMSTKFPIFIVIDKEIQAFYLERGE